MKTYHIIIDDNVNVKVVQVDLVPESNDDNNILDNPNNHQLEDHIILYLQGIFPGYGLTKTIDSSNFPKRVVVELVNTKGI